MNYLTLRIWFIVTITLALGAVTTRLAWEITYITAASGLAIIILLIFAIISVNALLIYLTIKPSLKKVKSLPMRIWVTALTTAGLISAIIHFVRFVPSPEAAVPLSVIIATLLLMSATSAYLLILWLVWFIGKA
jgi:hypothetical protein